MRGMATEPNFHKGFDEADGGMDVRSVSVQESGTQSSLCPAVQTNKRNRRRRGGVVTRICAYTLLVTAPLNTAA